MTWGVRRAGSASTKSYTGMLWAWLKVTDPPAGFDTEREARAVADDLQAGTKQTFEVFELPASSCGTMQG